MRWEPIKTLRPILARCHATASDLKQAFRQYPQPVVLVTGTNDHGSRGIIVSSFTSLSLTPPLVTFNVKIPSRALETMQKRFIAHILTHNEDHITIAKNFSQSDIEYDIARYTTPHTYGMTLDGCTRFMCQTTKQIEVADHCIIIGQVNEIQHGRPGYGLVYRNHRFLKV